MNARAFVSRRSQCGAAIISVLVVLALCTMIVSGLFARANL